MTSHLWFDADIGPDLEARVDAVSSYLRESAVERDRAGSVPSEEVRVIKQAQLTGLTVAPFLEGFDNLAPRLAAHDRWKQALGAVRRLARADLSGAALLGYNFMTLWRIEAGGDTRVFRKAVESTAAGAKIWGGANNTRGPAAQLSRVSGGFLLDGQKTFATGSQSADLIVISEELEEAGARHRLSFVLPADTPGLSHGDDWHGFGARRTASGSIRFDHVFVPEENVFRSVDARVLAHSIIRSTGSLSFQMLFVNLLLGTAQGAVEHALAYLAERGGWPYGGDQSYVAETMGHAIAQVNAAAALADRALDAFTRLTVDNYARTLSLRERGVLGDVILQAKIAADRAGLDVATKVLEATGARSATQEQGFDRFWRDIRIYTLHDPVALRARNVGLFWTRPDEESTADDVSIYHLV